MNTGSVVKFMLPANWSGTLQDKRSAAARAKVLIEIGSNETNNRSRRRCSANFSFAAFFRRASVEVQRAPNIYGRRGWLHLQLDQARRTIDRAVGVLYEDAGDQSCVSVHRGRPV